MALVIDRAGHNITGSNGDFAKFRIDRPGRIVSVGRHLNTIVDFRCLIHTISLEGAELEVSGRRDVPPNFFLSILGVREEIGSTLVRRNRDEVTISFNMLIDPDFLHHVVRLSAGSEPSS